MKPAQQTVIDVRRFASLPGARPRQNFAASPLVETTLRIARAARPSESRSGACRSKFSGHRQVGTFGEVRLVHFEPGACKGPDHEAPREVYAVTMTLSDERGAHAMARHSARATVSGPVCSTVVRDAARGGDLVLSIRRTLVERALGAMLGRLPDATLQFDADFQWRDCDAWHGLVEYLLACTSLALDVKRDRLLISHIEQLVVTTLLTVHSHNYSGAPSSRRGALLPRHVRKVQDYMQAYAHEELGVEAMADLAGVSVRSLYAGFKDFCGMSPMQYLKDVRLDRARSDLLGSAGHISVAGAAMRWGFGHLGRFSADYKTRFGESPSETLRRS